MAKQPFCLHLVKGPLLRVEKGSKMAKWIVKRTTGFRLGLDRKIFFAFQSSTCWIGVGRVLTVLNSDTWRSLLGEDDEAC